MILCTIDVSFKYTNTGFFSLKYNQCYTHCQLSCRIERKESKKRHTQRKKIMPLPQPLGEEYTRRWLQGGTQVARREFFLQERLIQPNKLRPEAIWSNGPSPWGIKLRK